MAIKVNGTTVIDDSRALSNIASVDATTAASITAAGVGGGGGAGSTTAWVNFNGRGTVSIRNDGNVGSITDVGTGRFNVNFSTSLASANYSLNYTINSYSSVNASVGSQVEGYSGAAGATLMTTSAVRVTTASTSANFEASHNLILATL